MAAPLADRIIEVLGDAGALQILRELIREERTQAALVTDLVITQSVASRTLKTLRLVGLVAAESPRGLLRVRAPDATQQLLLAGNNLAAALISIEAEEQETLADRTRRDAIGPADASVAHLPTVGR